MTLYMEALYADGSRILGNLDGQSSFLGVRNYRRTRLYRALKDGTFRAMPYVASWRVVDEKDRVIETIPRRLPAP